mmetsp:Transcript_15074/g.17062  ORF Transcript_15074/g.17062 Transcript_15074/m.17062 type:complete len:318 (+) Transcript_15074:149-1102(+)
MKTDIVINEEITPDLLRGVVTEFIAMILFVYVGTGAVVSTAGFVPLEGSEVNVSAAVSQILPIAFGFGVSILVLVFAFGSISGGHINPAVTATLTLVGKCSVVRGLLYFVAQLSGAFLGSLLLWASTTGLTGDVIVGSSLVDQKNNTIGRPPFNLGINSLNPRLTAGNGFVYEFMGTLLLCITVLMTAVHGKSLAQGKASNAPIAIGFAVLLAHVILVPYTGCGINPARTFGPALACTCAGVPADVAWGRAWWIYWVGPYFAAFVAALIYRGLYEFDADLPEEDLGEAALEKEKKVENESEMSQEKKAESKPDVEEA